MKEHAGKLSLALLAVAALLAACGGGSGGGGSDGGTMCGSNACAPNQICLRTQTVGGAQLCPQDGGSCPDGYDLVGGCCVMTPGWSCVARPGGCGATVTCACAMATLCTGGQTCTTPRENEIDCTLLAP
ncbi:MAG TPA: hypothetical protein VIQ54_09120 [Polyangia bacterium]